MWKTLKIIDDINDFTDKYPVENLWKNLFLAREKIRDC